MNLPPEFPANPPPSPIHSQIELETHQMDVFERMAMKSQEYEARQSVRRYIFIVAMLLCSGFLALAFIYVGAKDILVDVLKLALAFGAGAVGGFHYGRQPK